MEVYEVVVKAMVTETFRVIATDQSEATEKASLMFTNDNPADILDVKFVIHRNQEFAGS